MSSEEKTPSYLTDTILHCSILVCDTMVRMADLFRASRGLSERTLTPYCNSNWSKNEKAK